MEIEKSDIEKMLEYISESLQDNPIIDAIVAGILISADLSKDERLVKFVKSARSIMNNRRLKKEDQIMLYEEIIQKITGIGQHEAHNPAINNKNITEKIAIEKTNSNNNDLSRQQKINEIWRKRKRSSSEIDASISSSSCENSQILNQYSNVSKWAMNSVKWTLAADKRQVKRQRKAAKKEEEKK